MLFKKKKREERIVPVEEVQSMTARGMNDKDIIKELKSKGYSYDEIEKAMMQAVKVGVVEEPNEEPIATSKIPELEMPGGEFGGGQEPMLEMPEITEEKFSPEVVIEELIEGVVEEKWKRFEDRLKSLETELSKLKFMKQEAPLQTETKEDPRIDEFTTRLDDLEARIGGLEKAFRQFLPTLTKNIESLSGMIHEMKMQTREKVEA